MPRPRSMPVQSLTPGQATWILQRMIQERRVSALDLNRYVRDMQQEIDDLERQLAMLKAASGSSAAAPARTRTRRTRTARPAGEAPARRARSAKRRPARTPEQEQSMKLQGRYLGLIRQIPGGKRAQYQKLAKEKGREAAINAMAEVLKKNR